MSKHTFHILGVSHSKTSKEYCCDAFSQKIRLLCKMLTEKGHTVYHYGTEGSDPICGKNVNVLSHKTFAKVHEQYDWRKDGFKIAPTCEANVEFDKNAIIEINKRSNKNDFLLCSFGVQHKHIADNCKDLIVVESGIGYENTFAPHRVFETYAWMHFLYGKEGRNLNPLMYDAVIPHYYDLDDFIYSEKKEDYYFFIARQTPLKGLEVAVKCVEAVGGRLLVAGQGQPTVKSDCIEYLGVVGIEERAKIMAKAKAVFVPSLYVEPFGQTQVQALLAGTPIITTDFGAMTEVNKHGVTGYRCRTLEQFIWATKNISNIDPSDCRMHGMKYSLANVYIKYEEYFNMLHRLYTSGKEGWYQKNDERTNLDWLN